jgi:PAS domain S-box-containing protein
MPQTVSGLISYIGTLVQCAATLLTVLLFWVLERYTARRAYFSMWTRAWLVLMLALLALVARYTIVTSFDSSELDRDPTFTVQLLYFGYQFGKLFFAALLVAGTLSFVGALQVRKYIVVSIGVITLYAAISVYASRNLNQIVAWQAAPLAPAFGYCAWRLLSLLPPVRTLGTRLVGIFFAMLAVLWSLYFLAFSNVRIISGVTDNPWSVFTINNSFIDSLLAMLLSMGMVVMLMETATREAEEARVERLRDVALSEARLSSVIRSASDAIVTVDAEGKVNLFNPAAEEIFGVSVAEAMGASFEQFIIPEQRESLHAMLHRQTAPGRTPVPLTARKPFTGLRRRGEEFPLELSVSEFFLSGTRSQTVILRDLTDLRRAQTERDALHARLAHAQRMEAVGQLVSGVAHELNNPLAAVLNFSEILLHDPRVEHDRLALTTIREQARRCRTVVRNLLTFVREGPIRLQPVVLQEVLERVGRSFEPEFAQFGIHFKVNVAPGLPLLEADPEGIEQALTNLVSNAVHAIGTFGEVQVSASDAGSQVTIIVEDSGPGIPPEIIPRMFEPFFTSTRTGRGTGLGLSVCQGIVEVHGGSIKAENREPPARGARFVVNLPVHFRGVAEVKREVPRAAGNGEPSASPKSGRVLLVEDEMALRSALRRYFERTGWRVDEAETGWDALNRMLHAGTDVVYDLVISDLKMPGMSGIELHDHLAGTRPELLQRFIFVTGDVASSEAARFIAHTRQPVLEKPFELTALASVVAEMRKA